MPVSRTLVSGGHVVTGERGAPDLPGADVLIEG